MVRNLRSVYIDAIVGTTFKRQYFYRFTYDFSTTTRLVLLESIQKYDGAYNPLGNPTEFAYTQSVNGQFCEIADNWEYTKYPDLSLPTNRNGENGNIIQCGDFNGDGRTDFISTYVSGATANCDIQIHYSNGDGTFSAGPTNTFALSVFMDSDVSAFDYYASPRMYLCDVNNDFNCDLVFLDVKNYLHVYLGDGLGIFTKTCSLLLPNLYQLLGRIPQIVFPNLNGDNYPDLAVTSSNQTKWYVYKGEGDGTFTQLSNQYLPTVNSSTVSLWLDINGDGLSDKVWYDYSVGSGDVRLGRGYVEDACLDGYSYFNLVYLYATLYGDYNGDGKNDAARWNETTSTWDLFMGYGSGGVSVSTNTLGNFAGGNLALMRVGDFDGDGKTDIAGWNGTENAWDIRVQPVTKSDLLTKVTSSLGATTEITYENIKSNSSVPFMVNVVKAVKVKDGIQVADGGIHETISEYIFTDGLYDKAAREYRGFGSCSITKQIGTNIDQTIISTQQDPIYQGMVASIVNKRNGVTLKKEQNTWANNIDATTNSIFIYISQKDIYNYGSAETKQISVLYDYDTYGNLISVINQGDINVTGDENNDITDYAVNTTTWVMKPKYSYSKDANNVIYKQGSCLGNI